MAAGAGGQRRLRLREALPCCCRRRVRVPVLAAGAGHLFDNVDRARADRLVHCLLVVIFPYVVQDDHAQEYDLFVRI